MMSGGGLGSGDLGWNQWDLGHLASKTSVWGLGPWSIWDLGQCEWVIWYITEMMSLWDLGTLSMGFGVHISGLWGPELKCCRYGIWGLHPFGIWGPHQWDLRHWAEMMSIWDLGLHPFRIWVPYQWVMGPWAEMMSIWDLGPISMGFGAHISGLWGPELRWCLYGIWGLYQWDLGSISVGYGAPRWNDVNMGFGDCINGIWAHINGIWGTELKWGQYGIWGLHPFGIWGPHQWDLRHWAEMMSIWDLGILSMGFGAFILNTTWRCGAQRPH